MTEIWGKKGSFVSIAMQFLSIYPNPLYIIRCKPNFPHLKPLLFKRSPFAIQNESFYSPKGVLLQNHRIAPIIQSGFCCNLEVLLY